MADQNSENVEDEEQEYSDDMDMDTDTDEDEQFAPDEDDEQQADADQERAVATRQLDVPGRVFNPMGTIRARRLNRARNWAETGSIYAAIAAYMEIVERYPGSGAARAATEDLLELAQSLESYGMYYTALNIFRQLEEVAWE